MGDSTKEYALKIFKQAIALLAVGAAIGLTAAPANAEPARSFKTCSVNGAKIWLPKTCQTGDVLPYLMKDGGSVVWIGIAAYSTPAGCQFDWAVRDINTNQVQASGRSDDLDRGVTVVGDHHNRLELKKVGPNGCGGVGTIQNYSPSWP
jgi:hypothetical protein